MKKRRYPLPALGGIPLLMSIAVLLVALLALPVLNRVRQNQLTGKSEKAVEEFYNADKEAEVILALLRNGVPVEGVTEEKGIYYYSCSISETSVLLVEVEKDTWEVLRWETVDLTQ